MAQLTVPRPSSSMRSDALDDQTRHLFHRLVYDGTKDSGQRSAVHAKAFEEMKHDDPRQIFGPDSLNLDSLVSCLGHHANNMLNDPRLLRNVEKLQNDISKETLWQVCQKLFAKMSNVWMGICTLFAFGLVLCRQIVADVYHFIANTIVSFIVKLSATWLTQQGGWIGLLARGITGLLEVVTSWSAKGQNAISN